MCPPFGFWIQIFFMCFFGLSRNGLWMWISAQYFFVENKCFHKVPHLSWVWDFLHVYVFYLGTRIWSFTIICTWKNGFFGFQYTNVSLRHMENPFSSTLNVKILHIVGNEWIRYGAHVDIQISYKIL
jgi:hypothetical protein